MTGTFRSTFSLSVPTASLLVVLGLSACDRSAASQDLPGSPQPPDDCVGVACLATACGTCKAWETCENQACTCSPRCTDATGCLADECGGRCPCPDGYVETPTGVFAPEEQCLDTCLSGRWECGTLCGKECGSCSAGQTCVLGRCECAPVCDGTRCEDGCGGYCPCAQGTVCNAASACVPPAQCTDSCASQNLACGEMCGTPCGACANGESCVAGSCVEAVSCHDCPLSLRLASKAVQGGKLRWVTLSLDYAPTGNEARPRLADLRIAANKPVWLKSATEGPALTQVHKTLVRFEPWGEPWRKRADGSFQLLAYQSTNTERFADGQVVELTFALEEWGPVKFWLQRREQTFAPPESDAALQASAYDDNVIVTR